MTPRASAPLARAVLLIGSGVAAVTGLWRLARDPLLVVTRSGVEDLGRLSLEQVVTALSAAALVGCALWLLATTALAATSCVVTGLLPSSRHAAVLHDVATQRCPQTVRRLVTALLGVAVSAGVAGPALADPTGAEGLDGLPVPDRTTGAAVVASTPVTSAPAAPAPGVPADAVVVAPGDSLWSIAADLLPRAASDRQVTVAWQRLYRANAVRLGPDPDLIHPGTRLGGPDLLAPH